MNLGSGVGAADHCGWAVRPERYGEVRSWVAAAARRTSLLLSNLDPETGLGSFRRARSWWAPSTARGSTSPRTRIRSAAPASSEKQLRQYARKVERLGITFRWIGPEEMTPALLDVVFDLHARRQAAAGWTSMFDRSKAGLHERLVSRGGPSHGPAMVLAERDELVAVLYGFRWADVFAYYQTGWLPELAEANLATVLVAQTMQLAQADGATVFDFLRGAETYKYRFGATDRVDETWLVPAGLGGLALRASM